MKQFAVIGLGTFGSYLAGRLYTKGYDVLAIDKDQDRIQVIKDQVSRATVADATDRESMEALGLNEVDAAAVCLRSDMSASILTALNLRDIGVKRLLAMATSEAHGRILEKLGVTEVFFPDKDMAFALAERLPNPNMLEFLPFIEGYSIIEIAIPREFVGKTLRDLDLINRYGIQVLAVKEIIPEQVNLVPTAKYVLKDSDILILLGPDKSLEKLKAL